MNRSRGGGAMSGIGSPLRTGLAGHPKGDGWAVKLQARKV